MLSFYTGGDCDENRRHYAVVILAKADDNSCGMAHEKSDGKTLNGAFEAPSRVRDEGRRMRKCAPDLSFFISDSEDSVSRASCICSWSSRNEYRRIDNCNINDWLAKIRVYTKKTFIWNLYSRNNYFFSVESKIYFESCTSSLACHFSFESKELLLLIIN